VATDAFMAAPSASTAKPTSTLRAAMGGPPALRPLAFHLRHPLSSPPGQRSGGHGTTEVSRRASAAVRRRLLGSVATPLPSASFTTGRRRSTAAPPNELRRRRSRPSSSLGRALAVENRLGAHGRGEPDGEEQGNEQGLHGHTSFRGFVQC